MKFHIDFNSHPEAKKLNRGQSISITLKGTVASTDTGGVVIDISSMKVGKGGKMNTTEIMIANRLERIEKKMAGQATVV